MATQDFIDLLANRLTHWNQDLAKKAQAEMSSRSLQEREMLFKKREKTRVAAVMILLYPEKQQWHLPLILRPPYEGVAKHGGQIGLPGGGREAQDIDLKATALRELEEEVGIKLPQNQVIGALSELYIPPSDSLVTPFIGYLDHKPAFITDPKEVSQLYQVSYLDLANPEKRKEKTVVVGNQYQYYVPYFDIANGEVWGATAMILNEFLHLSRL
ncbi:NUDIX hydrolase [Hugenholtzia roseola]|uniref:NUDIX hydrolase n=1 Tax=Hugenholtzia roseola TaxID=1002 RepID=UPI00041357DF|nr:CoA pyrophosphatase [Hugenholtzia roseola]